MFVCPSDYLSSFDFIGFNFNNTSATVTKFEYGVKIYSLRMSIVVVSRIVYFLQGHPKKFRI